MPSRRTLAAIVLGLLIVAAGQAPPKESPPARLDRAAEPDEIRLGMTPAVACLSIDSNGDFEPLPGAELTSEEKLLVYYQPRNYKIERDGSTYHAHLVQDGEIHRRGEKSALQRKARMVDYDVKQKTSPDLLYLRNMVSLKGLKPGEYDFVIILHDELGKGPPAQQTLAFRVVPVKLPKAEGEGEVEKPR